VTIVGGEVRVFKLRCCGGVGLILDGGEMRGFEPRRGGGVGRIAGGGDGVIVDSFTRREVAVLIDSLRCRFGGVGEPSADPMLADESNIAGSMKFEYDAVRSRKPFIDSSPHADDDDDE